MNTKHFSIPFLSNMKWAALLLLVLLSCTAVPVVFAEEPPVAKIVRVECPPAVSPGESFEVVVLVEYSGAESTDIAILDATTGLVLDSKDLFTHMPDGTTPFTFQLIGRSAPGSWRLEATIRTWWSNAWYTSQNGGTFPFEVSIRHLESATVIFNSNVSSWSITFDGVAHPVSPSGLEITVVTGIHRIQADQELVVGEGVRAVFDHWSDGLQSASREIYVAGPAVLSAIYRTQFFLSVESGYGETVGTGWYPAGMNASFAAIAPYSSEASGATGGQASKFAYWSGDSNSSSSASWVIMDRPKSVIANWVADTQATPQPLLFAVSVGFLLCSLALTAVGVTVRLAMRAKPHAPTVKRKNVAGVLLMLLLTAVVLTSSFQNSHALPPTEPETITIGDASWYHWRNAASDTCLIWLGGGIAGGSSMMINPYEFESYNTIRFIQDLATYYDVLVLKAGSVAVTSQALNRTIHAEVYPGPTHFMQQTRAWINQTGYSYAYIVGYSVGALVGARETVLVNPQDWESPDGLVLITPDTPQDLSSRANLLRASLLVLSGDLMPPEFIASGERFFESAPDEGERGNSWYHKEYYLINGVQHEVWTDGSTGVYDERAALLTVVFIEKSKSLQFEQEKARISGIVYNPGGGDELMNPVDVTISRLDYPERVRLGVGFRITATVGFELSSNVTAALVAFNIDTAAIESAAERKLSGVGEISFPITLVSLKNATTTRLMLILLVDSGSGWTFPRDPTRILSVDATDLLSITVILGYSNVPIQFDNETLLTGVNGRLILNTTAGTHLLSAPPVIMISNSSRAVFQQWNETWVSPLEFNLRKDTVVLAVYRRQHYLNVGSPYAQTWGAGWYDENATATAYVLPPFLSGETMQVFVGWSGDSGGPSPVSNVVVDRAKNVQALWREIDHRESASPTVPYEIIVAISVMLLVASSLFAAVSIRQYRKRFSSSIMSE